MKNSKGKYEQTEKCKNHLMSKYRTETNFIDMVSGHKGFLDTLDFNFNEKIKDKFNCKTCLYGFEYRMAERCNKVYEEIPKFTEEEKEPN